MNEGGRFMKNFSKISLKNSLISMEKPPKSTRPPEAAGSYLAGRLRRPEAFAALRPVLSFA